METRRYNSYHTTIKTSYALGIQDQVLPDTFTRSIPRSTSYDWRKNFDPDRYVGSEFASDVERDLDQVKLMLDKRIKKLRLAFFAFARLYLTILNFIGESNFQKLILQNKDIVLRFFQHLPAEYFHEDLLCHFLQITPHQYKIWKRNSLYSCASSFVGYCTKRFPNQISSSELKVLTSLLSRKRFSSWSMSAIWGRVFKQGLLSMSRSSFYRYSLKLGFSKKRKTKKLKRKRGSVNATTSNQIWHMDVTEFRTADHIKFYIHTVLDNFSRKVVGYTVSRDKTAKTRLLSLKQSILDEFRSHLNDSEKKELDLIADGGGENINFRISNFIRHCHVTINKKIAFKDVIFSNSMIEGHFKTLKRHLRTRGDIYSYTIHDEIKRFVKDHNENKPTYKHQIYTPNEIHDNPKLADVKPVLEKSNKERLLANRTSCCKEIS